MAKHRRVWNESQYLKFLAEGRGQGTMGSYIPWVQIQDFSSQGVVSRVRGYKTGRIHHLLSNLELEFFYLLDWSDKTIDIREQYPLEDIADAIAIADEAGIRYPYDRSSGFPYVMTSDFLVTTRDGTVARAIKPSSALSNPRVREKLEIERRYWQRRNIEWRLVTEQEIPKTKVRNIQWICTGSNICDTISDTGQRTQYTSLFLDLYNNESIPVFMISDYVEDCFSLEPGTGLAIYKFLLSKRKIIVDLNQDINLMAIRK